MEHRFNEEMHPCHKYRQEISLIYGCHFEDDKLQYISIIDNVHILIQYHCGLYQTARLTI